MENQKRVDPEEPITTTQIYRDTWERRPLAEGDFDARLRDVVDDFNYVSRNEWAEAGLRAREMRRRLILEESE